MQCAQFMKAKQLAPNFLEPKECTTQRRNMHTSSRRNAGLEKFPHREQEAAL
jgi:hypothetical protein